MKSEIQNLKAAGKYAEAAELLCARGDFSEGAKLLADVWDFAGALRIARRAGLVEEAYRYAVEAKDEGACVEFRAALEHTVREEALRTLTAFALRRGRHEDAALFCLWSGESLEAARHFAAAGRPLRAAHLLVTRGRAQAAVEMLARAYKLEQDPEVALGLAQALVALGRHRKAIEVAQSVRMSGALHGKQQRLIARCLRVLGMTGAADGVEARLGQSGGTMLHGIRFLPLGPQGQLYDRWLRRTCIEEFSVGPSRRAQLLAFARVVHPHVQQVYDLRDETALLESPVGTCLSDVPTGERHVSAASLVSQLEEVLRVLSCAKLAHGCVDEEHIVLSPLRAVLLIPNSPMPSATVQGDCESLRVLRRRLLSAV